MHRTNRGIQWICFSACACLLIIFAAADVMAQGMAAGDVNRTFPVKGRTLITVKNVDGRTRITSGTKPEVNVLASKEVLRASNQNEARQAADEVQVRIEQIGNRVEIEATYPKRWNLFGLRPQVLVHFEVVAPSGSDIEVHNVDGAVIAEGFDGKIDLSTVDGSLTARQCSGSLAARTVDGALDLKNVRGDVSARTTDGKIIVDGAFRILEVQSTDGSIDVAVEPDSKMDGSWSIRSVDGAIRIELPSNFNADLEARTGDGHIRCDYPVTISGNPDKHRLSGRINGGGAVLNVQSGDGGIHIIKF